MEDKQMEETVSTPAASFNYRRWLRIGAPIVVLVIVLGAMLAFPRTSARQIDAELADMELLEELYGIRVKWIAVVANGGGIDFRFSVVNPDKANEFMHDPETMPILIAEDSGKRINPPQSAHDNMVYMAGVGYHTMYSNPGGVIQSGTPVVVVFGDYRLEPIKAH